MQPVEVSNTQPIQMVRLSLVRKVLDAYTDPKSISLHASSAHSAAVRPCDSQESRAASRRLRTARRHLPKANIRPCWGALR